MPSHGRRVHARLAQDREQSQAGRAQRGLSPLGRGQTRSLLAARGLVEHRPRENHAVQADAGREIQLGCAIPHAQSCRAGHGHVCAHVQGLAALAWKEKPNAAVRGPDGKINTAWHGEVLARGQQICGLVQLCHQVCAGFGEHSKPRRRLGVEQFLGCAGQKAQHLELPSPDSQFATARGHSLG